MTPAPVKPLASQSGMAEVTPGVPGRKPLTPSPKISVRTKDKRLCKRLLMDAKGKPATPIQQAPSPRWGAVQLTQEN